MRRMREKIGERHLAGEQERHRPGEQPDQQQSTAEKLGVPEGGIERIVDEIAGTDTRNAWLAGA